MTKSHMGLMCFAGSIRGAIAFGLAISINASSVINKNVMIFTTLILVFFTTIVFGALMPLVVRFFKKRTHRSPMNRSLDGHDEIIEKYTIARYEDANRLNMSHNEDSIIRSCWTQIDNKYFKPFLIEDWPNVKKDHNAISVKIINLFNEHQKEKFEKNKSTQCIILLEENHNPNTDNLISNQ
jgi:hypothetical protein